MGFHDIKEDRVGGTGTVLFVAEPRDGYPVSEDLSFFYRDKVAFI